MTTVNIFVFGTLKEGFPNYSVNNGIRLPGEFATVKQYPLYLVGERHSPWLVLDEGRGFSVKGQVFQVSKQALADMDALERIEESDGYRRIELDVVELATQQTLRVFVYGKPLEQLEQALIQSELAGEYTLKDSLTYRSRYA